MKTIFAVILFSILFSTQGWSAEETKEAVKKESSSKTQTTKEEVNTDVDTDTDTASNADAEIADPHNKGEHERHKGK